MYIDLNKLQNKMNNGEALTQKEEWGLRRLYHKPEVPSHTNSREDEGISYSEAMEKLPSVRQYEKWLREEGHSKRQAEVEAGEYRQVLNAVKSEAEREAKAFERLAAAIQ